MTSVNKLIGSCLEFFAIAQRTAFATFPTPLWYGKFLGRRPFLRSKSKKSKTGALESKVGYKGLCRKGMILLIVLVAARLDLILESNYIKDMVVIAFITNETLSIIENAGCMGIPMPGVVTRAIELLKNKNEQGEKKE